MTSAERLAIAREVALANLGLEYRWGGDDPLQGFDCSGFVIEILKSVGRLPRHGDWTARGLERRFRSKSTANPKLGALVFWGSPIYHVEFCLNDELSIGASGGRSSTTSRDIAVRQNAYIKIRPLATRDDFSALVDPFAEDRGDGSE